MRGSTSWQVQEIFHQSGINLIGQSRHAAKEAARAKGHTTPADLAQHTGINSYKTADSYRDVWRHALDFAKENYGEKNIERISGEHIQAYLAYKINSEIKYATFQQYAAALGKLETALNQYAENKGTGQVYDFRGSIDSTRELARDHLGRFDGSRAYNNPEKLVSSIANQDHQLVASIQLEGGARVYEASQIRPDQLQGDGRISIQGKGGKVRSIQVSNEIYGKLENQVQENGQLKVDYGAYLRSIDRAATQTGEENNGTHGLRWNFAQDRMATLQENGQSYEQSLTIVSQEMGHERANITEHYLR